MKRRHMRHMPRRIDTGKVQSAEPLWDDLSGLQRSPDSFNVESEHASAGSDLPTKHTLLEGRLGHWMKNPLDPGLAGAL